MDPKRAAVKLFLLVGLLICSAYLASGFVSMHYKLYLESMKNPAFFLSSMQKQLQAMGHDMEAMKRVLRDAGKSYDTVIRSAAGLVVFTFFVIAKLRSNIFRTLAVFLLCPAWICGVAAVTSASTAGSWQAGVLYVAVLLEKCNLAWMALRLGLAEQGKDLTKRVARLPKEPFEPSRNDEDALSILVSSMAALLLAALVLEICGSLLIRKGGGERAEEAKAKDD
eukprot:TRINITY_DN26799_c0_g1_i2.p1 TRINITY_DN26799_c0_g1~~TRINITY_DN26799_c0_g1_i2.p1  ORF type:complete len:234 (-),score=54.96 TRINITY_DN26799_c0_g1_i2:10-681(-)